MAARNVSKAYCRQGRVAIVDDVLTTSGSALQAVQEVERAGGQVVAVVCIVDRLEGARGIRVEVQLSADFHYPRFRHRAANPKRGRMRQNQRTAISCRQPRCI